MSRPVIYLAGPMTGLTGSAMTSWRENVAAQLPEFECRLPTRDKPFLHEGNKVLDDNMYKREELFARPRAFALRDEMDVRRADAIFMNFLGATRVSVGTVLETGMARGIHTPTLLVIEEDNVHMHPLLREWSTLIVRDLDEGVAAVRSWFNV